MKSARTGIGMRRLLAFAAAALSLAMATPSWALSLRPMKMDEVIRQSDSIFLAVCEGKRCEFRSGNILTIYTMRPQEFWKGSVATNAAGTFDMEDLGGSIGSEVKLGQYVGGEAAMIPGEEVLLFTAAYRPAKGLAASGKEPLFTPGNPQIIGRVQGRFSVLTEPSTGEKFVVRPGLEERGIIPSDASMRKFLNAQQQALGGGGLPANAVMKQLERDRQVRKKINEANPGSVDASKVGEEAAAEVKDYEKLSTLRVRITKRVEAMAKQGK